MGAVEQTSLFDEMWECDYCHGRRHIDEDQRPCPVCEGAGVLDYDPEIAIAELGF